MFSVSKEEQVCNVIGRVTEGFHTRFEISWRATNTRFLHLWACSELCHPCNSMMTRKKRVWICCFRSQPRSSGHWLSRLFMTRSERNSEVEGKKEKFKGWSARRDRSCRLAKDTIHQSDLQPRMDPSKLLRSSSIRHEAIQDENCSTEVVSTFGVIQLIHSS